MGLSHIVLLVCLNVLFLGYGKTFTGVKHCDKCPDPDIHRTVPQIIKSRRYPVEEHDVHTSDGFILGVHRIPHGRGNTSNASRPKPVVFLQHGLLMDSANWVINYPSSSLGYILADIGFDVWLGNTRGNVYSRRHSTLHKYNLKFRNWSWQEMAEYDLPAMLEYVLKVTGYYVGHSQGTLIGFASFSSNPRLAKKIKQYFALAPAFWVRHTSPTIRGAALALFPLEKIYPQTVVGPLVGGKLLKMLSAVGFCGGVYSRKVCYKVGQLVFGFNDGNINKSRIPVIIAHYASRTSLKNFIHYGQMILDGRCQKHDYGLFNWFRYRWFRPPTYDVTKMTVPTALFGGSRDLLSDPYDVKKLKFSIKNLTRFENIKGWNHADFLFGLDAPTRLYSKIVKMLKVSENMDN